MNEVGPVAVALSELPGRPNGESGLACPASAGQRDEPPVCQQLGDEPEFLGPTDECCRLGRNVSGTLINRPRGWKDGFQPADRQLSHAARKASWSGRRA